MTTTIRVLTWNVHGGVGLDGMRDFSRIVDQIVSIDADIVALQEVEGRNRGNRSLPMQILEDRLGHHGVSASTISAADGDYGQFLLSRWPLSRVETHDLSIAVYEPRRAIAATVETPVGNLRVIATHLGLRIAERRRQLEMLQQSLSDDTPLVLLGDLNDWLPCHSARSALGSHFADSTRLRTYPARVPLFALDRIFSRPAGILTNSYTVRAANLLSDHLPLVGCLTLPLERERARGGSNIYSIGYKASGRPRSLITATRPL